MRTLKKTLALVLVLGMLLGLCVNASADFSDAEEINYAEAVDVLTAIGVIEGMPDGSFDPTGTLTRAQAAKIIVYLLGAEDFAVAASAGFSDVSEDHWAAPYIAYCAAEGIIAGYGDGSFGPSDTLTSYQWAKMLLVALGYDGDDYLGSAWQIAVAKDAAEIELFDGNESADKTKAATREEACLYALNAINYGTEEEVYVVSKDGVNYKFDNQNDALVFYAVSEDASYKGAATVSVDSILEDVHGIIYTDYTDSFGRPGVAYYDEDTEGDELFLAFMDAPAARYTGAVYEKTIYSDLGASGISGSDAKYVVIDSTCVDGVENTEDVNLKKGSSTVAAYSGPGTIMELYKVSTNHYVMVVINEYFGTVTKVTAANSTTEADRYITIDGTYTYETEDYAKNSKVLYRLAGGSVVSVSTPDVISGTVTKIANGSTYTIDGEKYAISNCSDVELDIGDSGSWHIDSCGNIIAEKSATRTTTYYGYLLDYETSDYSSSDLLGNGASVAAEKVKFIDAAGEELVLDADFDTNSYGYVTEFVGEDAGWEDNLSGVLFAYTLNSDGEISSIANVDAASVEDCTLVNGKATLQGYTLTDDTVFFYADVEDDEYAVYTGYTNIPSSTTGKLSFIAADDGEILALVLEVSSVATTSSEEYVYFASGSYSVETTSDGTVYTYDDVYINGEYSETGLRFEKKQPVSAGDVWTFTVSGDDDMTTLGTKAVDGNDAGTEVTKIQSTYYIAGSVVYTDSDTVYYEIDMSNGSIAVVDGLTELSEEESYGVYVLYADGGESSDSEADAVFYYVD